MRTIDGASREIVDIISEVVKRTSENCRILVSDDTYCGYEIDCPPINYIFGNARYVKDRLDELSVTEQGNDAKFPLIALFCPVNEQRDSLEHYTQAKINILIACSTKQQWSNEQRQVTSFQNILRPIYHRFIEALKEDRRLDFGYDETVVHNYSENYSYGRYGAHTADGEVLSEPIDAINISRLQINVKQPNCR